MSGPLPSGKIAPERPVDLPVQMQFDDNSLLPPLFGERDRHLDRIERQLGVSLVPRGNLVAIGGSAASIERARSVLGGLYDRLKRGLPLDLADVDAALRLADAQAAEPAGHPQIPAEPAAIRTRKRQISARTPTQSEYIRALRDHALVFGLGPAGTGKTYLAVAAAVDMLMTGQVERIILSRPAVEAGERLGFLPGDLKEKVDPYLRPLYDALHDMLPGDQIMKRLGNGDIEVAPLAFMRGRTLARAFVILDEAQNTTPVQMKMFLTRLGEGARMAVTGDLSQVDLPRGAKSGLADALETLAGVEGIAAIRFTGADVVRHPLVMRIVNAYEARDLARRQQVLDAGDGIAPDPA
jgi:phosphate starvation-inducible PhoH-like protein